ncbi:hypothetical protein KSP39_PZI024215 [Platanthera zijinensis]|uniref:Protein NO VEIN C-terminal domain-containing protein n=1 Tax=Platanthera zijinensis TaxID=2320716 RepID=A0AAP0ASW9_9ASPA
MYGSPAGFRPRGGRSRGGRSQPIAPHSNFLPEIPNVSPYASSSYFPSWHGANPSFPNPSFHPSQIPQKDNYGAQYQKFTVELLDSAVAKAQKTMLDAEENVSVWKITQSVARSLKVSSWDALGFRTVDVPALREIQFVEGKVNAFIHCFVNSRKMTSVHELGLDLCKNEGVEKFEELGIGPLLRHPLVCHYFSVSPEAKEICEITTEDLVNRLSTFLYRKFRKEIEVEEFLDFLVQKCSVASKEHLGVRIRSMGESFINTWKDACKKHGVNEVLSMMIDSYGGSEKKKRKLRNHFLSPIASCILNVAVLRACEMSLMMYFSVKEFKCLNHGDFFEFVDKYASHFPDEIQYLLAGEITKKSFFEVSMLQKQFFIFLRQAMVNMDKDMLVRPENISVLLRKQFPLIGLKVTVNDLHENISNIIKCQEKNDPSSVSFSATLLGNISRGSLTHHEKSEESSNVVSERDGPFGSLGHVSAKDAIECLLKAPMLSDLKSWSHWDFVFAPSLGSLLEWLFNQGPIDKLACIVTSDGRIIRIDHSATPDDFFKASIQGSSFQAALKLLSLLDIYGGSYKAPVSLLKCYFQQAIDVLSENFSNDIEWNVNSSQSSPVRLSQINKSYSSISVFILECLGHLPSEFRSFAAEILVSGLRFFTRNASEIILHECRYVSDRIMLHDIGLSLGILEWIKDYDNFISKDCEVQNAAVLIEQIRREEFGLYSDSAENDLLKKQHDRLGRALNCLSRELYSQDSHIILELIQNADDNCYPENIEPTLVFILQDNGVIVLNNELGFSAQNMRALCDIGSSTKKGSSGYIGQKGIGFKSVFRVTDAPEIHSNGFHVKFDINEGQIGFVLPTIVPPCNIDFFRRQVLCDTDQLHDTSWNTCIVLPFKSELKSGKGMNPILSMFSDIHPHLLLFLQRLQCIKYKNMISNELVILRRESNENGIVTVSLGKDKMSWLLISRNLEPTLIRPDVQTTKITMAFPLEESENGKYKAHLNQQHVFAFLPLRKYGLKFILQGDFILPSSREEVDRNSAWNQWLLTRMPDLFVSAEKSFCALPCFHENLGKAVTEFMSFVPLMGEVYGFFSDLPRMILKELRKSNCLLLDGSCEEWAPPCRVLRNCDDLIRNFLTGSLLQQHLGLGYLHRDIVLHDSLARELGVQDYGPEFLVGLQSSICNSDWSRSLDLEWFSCWLNALCISFSFNASKYFTPANAEMEVNLIRKLKNIPFIPLSDGSYVSVSEGPVWLPFDISTLKSEAGNVLKHLPGLYSKLKTVSTLLFSTEFVKSGNLEENRVENVIRVLVKIGVRHLSSHDVIRNHILPSISCGNISGTSTDLMTQYLFYIMIHLQSACSSCKTERVEIISELQKQTIISTNNGYLCPLEKPIHFSKEFCNPFDMKILMNDIDIEWNELDIIYLQHPTTQSLFNGLNKWRDFFLELGVTDFLQVRSVEKNVQDVLDMDPMSVSIYSDVRNGESVIKDWESPELVNLLSALSTKKHLDKCKYLLQIFDKMWDGCYGLKSKCHNPFRSGEQLNKLESSFMRCLRKFKWVVSSLDDELHYPQDVFHDCKAVHSILGAAAPYTVPKVKCKRFVEDIGLKVQVTLDDVIRVSKHWRNSKISASILQMTKLYTFVRDELSKSKGNIIDFKSNIIIFVPSVSKFEKNDVVPGTFMLPEILYWHDPTGCMEKIREIAGSHSPGSETEFQEFPPLSVLYPGFYDFFVVDCGAPEAPSFRAYLKILRRLSNAALPSEVAHEVFQVFLKWADDFKLELLGSNEVNELKDYLSKSENTVLPTVQDTWVSLNPTFGVIYWTDEEKSIEQYKDFDDVHFLQFGELTAKEREMLRGKVSIFLENIGIRALTDENIFYTTQDTDSHALFLELSRFFFHGTPNLHMANFLHIITSKAELGHTEEQIEPFIVDSLKVPPLPKEESLWVLENEILCLKTVENDRSYEAGRQGEMIAYRYFTEKLGEAAVKWLNRDFEMGLPYDLIIEQDSKKVYVEVKSTVSAKKNWFHLSTNEWHCAVEKEESFMIARVILSSAENAKVLIFKNPAKLCRENMLQLALIQPLESENLAS